MSDNRIRLRSPSLPSLGTYLDIRYRYVQILHHKINFILRVEKTYKSKFWIHSAIISQYDVNDFLKFHPYFIKMRFHEVFVNRSNFEPLKIEEILFVKMQVCENRYALLNMNSSKCATIKDSLALLTICQTISPRSPRQTKSLKP